MNIIQSSQKGIGYLGGVLKEKTKVITKAILWKIPHDTRREDIRLKIGRYNIGDFGREEIELIIQRVN